ncbi:MAG: type II secretion system minor pseudopilin GspK [Coxiellaceae bacterium]|nr:type II secretion system minor pseudopilin GspK [Coxiellaceae bacterium]
MKCQPLTNNKQRAAALIVAIMVTVVVATIATAMMVSQHLDIFETGMVSNMTSMMSATQGIQDMVKQQLLELALKNKKKRTIMTFAENIQPIDINGVKVSGQVSDAQARFNINLLTQTANIPPFAKLITAVDGNFDHKVAMAVAQQVSAWVRKSKVASGYQSGVTYQLAHRPMADITELRLVSGVTASLMQKLFPYTVALPPKTKMNLNAVSAPVMWALFKDKKVTMDKVQAIIACRKSSKGFKSVKVFTKCMQAQNVGSQAINSKLMTYDSKFFVLEAPASKQNQRIVNTSLIAIGTSIPQWQSKQQIAATTTAKGKKGTGQVGNTHAGSSTDSAGQKTADLSQLSGQKKPKKPLHAYVLWQSI